MPDPLVPPNATLSDEALLDRVTPPITLTPADDALPSATQPYAPMAGGARYRLAGEIGRGGMGLVLRGHDPHLNRELAVKVLLAAHQERPETQRRFLEEAQIGGQLQHPGVVPVYEVGRFPDGLPYFTMKLVQGETLGHLLGKRPSPAHELPRFLQVFEQMCQTLAYAHARGVIHRDLKPANVMVGAFGEVQVMDWGLAKVLTQVSREAQSSEDALDRVHTARRDDGSESRAGSVLGTPAYMPPEQARGETERLDERADVFGLGAILCEILTGKPPYVGKNVTIVLRLAVEAYQVDMGRRLDVCGADAELTALTRACLAPEPADRPRHAGEVAARVTAYRAGVQERLRAAEMERAAAEARAEAEGRERQAAQEKARAERQARRLTLGLAATVLAAVLAGGAGYLWVERDRAARQTETMQREAEIERERIARQTAAERQVAETTLAVEADLGAARAAQQRADWPEAARAFDRAEARLGDGDFDDERGRIKAGRGDLDLVAKLDAVRSQKATWVEGRYNWEAAARDYPRVFLAFGFDVLGDSPDQVAARIQASAIREPLLAALDDWAASLVRKDKDVRDRVLEVAIQADTDEQRKRFRDLWRRNEMEALLRLADEADPATLAPSTLIALAQAIADRQDAHIRLLQRSQIRYPGDFWLNLNLAKALNDATPPRTAEAVSFYRAALAARPSSADAAHMLGVLLNAQGKHKEAEATFREAIRLNPNDDSAHGFLGLALMEQGKDGEAEIAFREAVRLNPDIYMFQSGLGAVLRFQGKLKEAEAAYREAIRLKPDNGDAYNSLGTILRDQGKPKEAEVAYREAIRLKPTLHSAHFSLGNLLEEQGKLKEAEAAYREAIRSKPDYVNAYLNLGNVLNNQSKPREAEMAYREAIRLKPNDADAHFDLGIVLNAQGKPKEAEAAYREAIRLQPDHADAHLNLGSLLSIQDKLQEAEGAFREALRIKPEYALAHCHLGFVLRRQGRFADSLTALRRGHELGSAQPGWSSPSADWLREAKRFAALESRLPALLKGDDRAADAAEALQLTTVCQYKNLSVAVVRFAEAAFMLDPNCADDLVKVPRFNAARHAALAAVGQGADAADLDDAARMKLRKRALLWVRADLTARTKSLDGGTPENRALVERVLRFWKRDSALAALRDGLDQLPEDERQEWRTFWADVDALLVRASAK